MSVTDVRRITSTIVIGLTATLAVGGLVLILAAPKGAPREASALSLRTGAAGSPLGLTLGGAW